MNADSGRIKWLHRVAPTMSRGTRRRRPEAPLPLALAPWLELKPLEYQALNHHWAVVRMLANIDRGLKSPAGAQLRVQGGGFEVAYRPFLSVTDADGAVGSGLLWQASFGVPLEVVEYPSALFQLTASDGITLALPAPIPHLTAMDGARAVAETALRREVLERHYYRRHARRHLVALASGFALAAGSGSAVAVADSVTTTSTTTTTSQTTSAAASNPPSPGPAPIPTSQSTTATTSSSATATYPTPPSVPAPAPPPNPPAVTQIPPPSTQPAGSSHTTKTSAPAAGATSTTPAPLKCNAPTILLTKLLAQEHRPPPPPGTKPLCVMPPAASTHHASKKGNKHKGKGKHQQQYPWVPAPWQIKVAPPQQGAHPSGGATAAPHKVTPVTPRAAVDVDNRQFRTDASALSIASTGAYVDPFTAAQIERFSSLIGSVDQPPKYLVRIYKAAGRRYHVPWQILGAINAIESDYGRNLSVSSAGAIGWMQFMPGTWLEYAVDASGNPQANPYNPRDAIFTAARYLAANGAPRHMRKAIFAYNHALWYVDAVLWRAELISDRALKLHRRVHGYALPLDARYMHQLGRTDDGLDIETAPDGVAVYSITPGIVTAVASDPAGFGPNYPVVQVTKGPLAGQYIYYGHVAESLVHVGQHVLAGQPIAVMGHTGDAASLGHGHIEIGFSDASGAPLNQHGGATAWTPSGDAMRHVLVAISHAFRIKNA